MKVVVLSPHTDDSELGAGGTISRLSREGHEIHCVVFSTCAQTLPPSKENMLRDEFKEVMKLVSPTEYYILDYTVRRFNEKRQGILDDIVKIGNRVKPDLVIGPSPLDYHQDHMIVANEMIRAFKISSSIISYELPWNHLTFDTQMFFKLDEVDIVNKIKQLSKYKSQIEGKTRLYFKEEFIRGLANVRGVQCKTQYAEAFSVFRWMQ